MRCSVVALRRNWFCFYRIENPQIELHAVFIRSINVFENEDIDEIQMDECHGIIKVPTEYSDYIF